MGLTTDKTSQEHYVNTLPTVLVPKDHYYVKSNDGKLVLHYIGNNIGQAILVGAGTQGAKGDIGDKGEKGDKGDKGDQGEQGIKGEEGDKGETGDRGLTGFPGDKGPDGNPGTIQKLSHIHTQITPASEWPVKHDMNCYPAGIIVTDGDGNTWFSSVQYVDSNNLIIKLGNATFAGTANIS